MEEKKIKFSIIIPVYNVEKFLESCLKSICELKLGDKEIILINDGSTDNSLEILEKYIKIYPENIKIISQKNQGVSKARNVGIENSIGEYILFIDSDDFIDPKQTEKILNVAYEQEVDILIGSFFEYFSEENIKSMPFIKKDLDRVYDGMKFLKYSHKERCFSDVVWNKVYNRRFLLENKLFFKEKLLHEDTLFNLKAFCFAKKIKYFIGTPFYYYRQNNMHSIMKTKTKKNYEHILYIIQELLDFIEDRKINDIYLNKHISGLYLQVVSDGKFKNEKLFKRVFQLRHLLKRKIKLFKVGLKSKNYEKLEIAKL
jgi:hypothetical protein